MKIICPKCNSAYNLDKKNLPKNGRKLKCFICETIWIQHPSGEAEKVKDITDFINEIKIRQDAIKSSLEKSTSLKKSSEKFVFGSERKVKFKTKDIKKMYNKDGFRILNLM